MPRPPKSLPTPASTISPPESAADDGLDSLFEMTAKEQKAQDDAAAARNASPVPAIPSKSYFSVSSLLSSKEKFGILFGDTVRIPVGATQECFNIAEGLAQQISFIAKKLITKKTFASPNRPPAAF